MPTSFFERLDERARKTGSLLCVGLDPHAAWHVRQALRDLSANGRSLVLVTHHIEDIVAPGHGFTLLGERPGQEVVIVHFPIRPAFGIEDDSLRPRGQVVPHAPAAGSCCLSISSKRFSR